ncbi:MAG: T9SS type A sorting domain-containing protein [Ferruginibacter sp.]|nr:T9SS type A sorting domain-containing protein [Ferruginibacter sp.]
MKPILFLFVFSIVSFQVNAQVEFNTKNIDATNYSALNASFKEFYLFSLPTASLLSKINRVNASSVNLKGNIPGLDEVSLLLQEVEIFDEHYTVSTGDGKISSTHARGLCKVYKGTVDGDNDSRVRLTLAEGVFYGMIRKNGITYFIEPVNYLQRGTENDLMIIYRESDVFLNADITCGVTERAQYSDISVSNAGLVCKRTRIAIASDSSMFARYNSVIAVEIHNIGVLNNVMWDYVNAQFDNNIEFVLVGQYISTNENSDPISPLYNGTNSSTILSGFRTWGNAGNFGVTYDIAQFWTARDIDNDGLGGSAGIVGLAYVGVVCSSSRYHILEDYPGVNMQGSGYQLRVLAAHEIGHNFSANHDAAGSGYIMAPSVNNTSIWSAASITSVDGHVNSRTCLTNCELAGAPIADFVFSPQAVCTGVPVQFIDHSLKGPSSWNWSFQNGTPASSTNRNPVVTYNSQGAFLVTLSATNAAGTTSVPKEILISPAPATACMHSETTSSNAGVKFFSLGSIQNRTDGANLDGDKYLDFSCSQVSALTTRTIYTATVQVGTTDPSNKFNLVQFFIDYNNDGDFDDADENVYSSSTCYIGTVSFQFTTPTNVPVTDKILRARIIAKDCIGGVNACFSVTDGQVEDYGVFFLSNIVVPVNLLQFTGSVFSEMNNLYWQTSNEINLSHFVIERSVNGINFLPIVEIEGTGSVTNGNSYTYSDAVAGFLHIQRFFYRLKMIDHDGSFSYSEVVMLVRDADGKAGIYPNPVKAGAMVWIVAPKIKTVHLLGINGQHIKEWTNDRPTEVAQINIPTYLAPGLYLLKILTSSGVISAKVSVH